MTLIVEDGSGIYEANSYVGPGFVRSYLASRNKATAWISATRIVQNAALIAATDYIDKRFGSRFLGVREFTQMSVSASNILTFFTNALPNDEVTIGDVTYTFKETGVDANDITIGATAQETSEALVAALAGTPHPTATGTSLDGSDAVLVRAIAKGPLPTAIGTSSNGPNLSWDTPTLTGGQQFVSQQLEFPRKQIFTKEGNRVVGIPESLKQAVAEYASRAITMNLMPDPEVDPSGQTLSRVFDKVGPIETERRFVFSSGKDVFQRFPEADKLLTPFLMNSGQVFR